jgi:Tfp pilus assembly protein PilN
MSRLNSPELALNINLLPFPSRYEDLGRFRLRALCISLVMTALALLSIRIVVSTSFALVGDSSPQVEMAENEIVELQSELERRRSALTMLRDKRKAMSEINAKKRSVTKLLSTFSDSIPVSVTIRSIAIAPSTIDVVGVARDVEAVRQWMKEIVALCGGYAPSLQHLRVVRFGRVQVQEFAAQIGRPHALERIEPCVSGEATE